jgi:hypothetical protein
MEMALSAAGGVPVTFIQDDIARAFRNAREASPKTKQPLLGGCFDCYCNLWFRRTTTAQAVM